MPIYCCLRDRTETTADLVKQHAAPDKPRVRLGMRAEYHALIDDVDRLSAGIEQDDANYKKGNVTVNAMGNHDATGRTSAMPVVT